MTEVGYRIDRRIDRGIHTAHQNRQRGEHDDQRIALQTSVAGGTEKVPVICAALHGGLINVLMRAAGHI
mgnify:CR=1 FL=1